MSGIDELLRDLGAIRTIVDRAQVKLRSRDFYWYSPILKKRLKDVTADLVVLPASEAELIETLRACHARRVPVTPRGAGTGNYGQAMPVRGGVLLDLSLLTGMRLIEHGRLRAAAGAKLCDIDARARTEAGAGDADASQHLAHRDHRRFVCGGRRVALPPGAACAIEAT
jgi:FAD/FMN-containing dehydrogenase